MPVRRALISVYDKEGLLEFATRLSAAGVSIVSSGGTARALQDAGLVVSTVEEVTGAPEMLGGRVKTLHPSIHGGILARADHGPDLADLEAYGIEPFQLVVVNLYPFRETVASGAGFDEIIEKIDIGGPSMVRGAAKNHAHVGVVTSPDQYESVAKAVESGGLDDELRRALAAEAFFHTASYDSAIVNWLGNDRVIPLRRVSGLRYGENPHQDASLFAEDGARPWWLGATLHQGKEMSYNNYQDAEAAWRLATSHPGTVAIIKHTNPCGAAHAGSVLDAFERAWACDPLSAFGGVVAINGVLDEATAQSMVDKFIEVVICADSTSEALAVLEARQALRVLQASAPDHGGIDLTRIEGGLLIQERDTDVDASWDVVSEGLQLRKSDQTSSSHGRSRCTPSPTPSPSSAVARRSGLVPEISPGSGPPSVQCSRPASGPRGRWQHPTPSSLSVTGSTLSLGPG